jgi:hypothetical protein
MDGWDLIPNKGRDFFPGGRGVKQMRHEADHIPLSSAKVKNVWHYTSIPQVCFHGVVCR